MTLSEFLRVAAPVSLPTTNLWLSSYVLLVAVARGLDAGELGEAATFVVLLLVVDAAAAAIRHHARSPHFGRELAILVLLLATPILAATFHLGSLPLALFDGASLVSILRIRPPNLLSPGRASMATSVLAGVVRVVAGASLVAMGLGVTGVLLGSVAGEVTALLSETLLPRSIRIPERTPRRDPYLAEFPPAALAAVTLAVFAHADVLLARRFLPEGAASAYAGGTMVARCLLFTVVLAALALRVEVAPIRSADPFHWFRQWIATGTAAALVAVVVLVIFRAPILEALLGAHAGNAIDSFPFIAAGIALLTVVSQLASFHRVVDSNAHILTIVGLLLEVAVVAASPATNDRLAVAMLVAAGLTALLLYQASWAITRWSPPLTLLRTHEEVGSDAAATEPVDEVELSIIVPCHNSGPALRDFLARLEGELSAASSYEIIVVSDGSTDETLITARELASPTLRVVHYPERSGKGHALRVGLSLARGRYVGFIDSDGDIDPQALGPFLMLMRTYEPDIVLGSKRHPMSQVAYPPLRRIMSWVYHKLTRILFRVNVRDTQTGLKVIRREVLAAVLPRMFEKRYAWDLELLVVGRMLGYSKVFEAPVRIEYRFSSQVDPNAAFRIILDSTAIFYRRYILNSYRHTGDRLAVIREPQVRA
jgi:hypothetical protein